VDLNLLEKRLAERGEPAYRARQVWEWAARGAGSYEEMTNLPASRRGELEHEVPLSTLTVEREDQARDGTRKALLATAEGRPVETVLMTYRDGRRSVCVSSQSGCPLTCAFCATGTMKFGRNLTASEILDQVLHFQRGVDGNHPRAPSAPLHAAFGAKAPQITHVVFRGMGEPMMNVDAVIAACERLPSLGVASSRTTVSTVGWVPGIQRLTTDGPPVRLALSLHAADEALRSELMPVNDRHPLPEVLDACRAWREARRKRVFIEYVMLAGVNDRYEQAVALADVLSPREAFKVNLIPYNPTAAGFEGSSRSAIDAFAAALRANGVPATVRLTRGRDIDAACGQLAAAAQPTRAPLSAGSTSSA
jgi:23S rRNA (adenine2503-C2)-methyltransferase